MENSFFVQCSKSKKIEGIDFSQLKLYELTMNGKAWMSNASVSFGYDAKTCVKIERVRGEIIFLLRRRSRRLEVGGYSPLYIWKGNPISGKTKIKD